jgi:glycogen debranching enzyme
MPARVLFTCAALLIATTAPVFAGDAQNAQGAVELSDGTKVPQTANLPKLNLTNEQREQIRKGVLGQNTEVEFHLKTTKSAKDFTPQVGAKLPKGVTGHSLPPPVLAKLPQLRNYRYITMKDQVLIVNAMTKTIVDLFPETKPLI